MESTIVFDVSAHLHVGEYTREGGWSENGLASGVRLDRCREAAERKGKKLQDSRKQREKKAGSLDVI